MAVVSANLAAARAIPEDPNRFLLAGVAPIGLAPQVGSFLVLRGRGRAFWAGFVGFGLASLMSFLFALVWTPRTVGWDPASGRFLSLPGPLWMGYDNVAFDLLDRWFQGWGILPGSDCLFVAAAVIYFAPQLFIALGGGLAGLVVSRAWARTISSGRTPAVPSSAG